MNKDYRKLLLTVVGAGVVLLHGCRTLETDTFEAKRALYFEKRIYNEEQNEWRYIDTANISITNHPGQELLRHPFRICLIGDTLSEDLEYSLIQVDTMTTAPEGTVSLPEKLTFRRGKVTDSLWLTIHTDRVSKGAEYYITFRLVANENFELGHKGYHQVRLWFNNKESQPLWWNERIVKVYLGPWSSKKFATLILATQGITTFEGLSASEMRLYSLQLKDYIEQNNVTEADGSPMIVPIY